MNDKTKKKILDAIRARTKDEREEVKNQSLHALTLFEESSQESIPELVRLVVDGEKNQRSQARVALVAIGEKAVDEVIEKLVNNEDDFDARAQGIAIITEILATEEQKIKSGEKKSESCGCKEEDDPHGLGKLMRKALKKILTEAFEEAETPKKGKR
jgi:hypothetical protein